jgi:hypothetical protein
MQYLQRQLAPLQFLLVLAAVSCSACKASTQATSSEVLSKSAPDTSIILTGRKLTGISLAAAWYDSLYHSEVFRQKISSKYTAPRIVYVPKWEDWAADENNGHKIEDLVKAGTYDDYTASSDYEIKAVNDLLNIRARQKSWGDPASFIQVKMFSDSKDRVMLGVSIASSGRNTGTQSVLEFFRHESGEWIWVTNEVIPVPGLDKFINSGPNALLAEKYNALKVQAGFTENRNEIFFTTVPAIDMDCSGSSADQGKIEEKDRAKLCALLGEAAKRTLVYRFDRGTSMFVPAEK